MKKDIPNLPGLAKETVIPFSVFDKEQQKEKEKQYLKEQRRHDYKVALFSAIVGAVSGGLVSLLITLCK